LGGLLKWAEPELEQVEPRFAASQEYPAKGLHLSQFDVVGAASGAARLVRPWKIMKQFWWCTGWIE